MIFLFVLLGFLVGAGGALILAYFLPKEKIKKINDSITKQEQEQIEKAKQEIKNLENQYINTKNEIIKLTVERDSIKDNLIVMQNQAKQAAEDYYKTQMDFAQEKLDIAIENISEKYSEDEEQCRQEYLQLLKELAYDYNLKQEEYNEKFKEYSKKLNTLKETVDAATTIAKREQQEKEKIDFYRLKLSDVDKDEIKILRTVEPHLRNKEALNKVIWKVYYEKPYTDLIGRVIGNKIKTGIYKITNIENQMCYVGQSVDIASRWKQHIKRGIGAEAPTRNKLYPAMATYGPENFTYEIIEECPKENLDEKEKYWQNFYNALTYGYSMR